MRSGHDTCQREGQRSLAGSVLALGAWMAMGGAAWAGPPIHGAASGLEQAPASFWTPPRFCPESVVVAPVEIERWVEAAAATVVVETSITVDPAGLAKARGEAAAALRRLVPEQPPERVWRWTSAASSRESSGLARFTGRAEIRASESAVGDVWERAKAASRPGLSVRVIDLRWTPSLADREAERQRARDQLYRLAREEAARIRAALGGDWRVGRITIADERAGPAMDIATHEALRAESHGSADIRADRLVVAATVELVEPRCAGGPANGGRP